MRPELRAELARLIVLQVTVHTCFTGLRMAAPLMALREGRSPAAVGVLLALFAVAAVFSSLASGRMTDRLGLRPPARLAVALTSAGALMAVAWPNFLVLCLTALACGAASNLTIIAVQRQVGRLANDPTELRQVFSWAAVGPSISNFLGPLLAGLVIDLAGFRWAFALLALVPWLGWWALRRAREFPREAVPDGQGAASSWNLLREPAFRRLMAINWVLASCWDMHTFLVPLIGNERGLSATAIGTVLGGFALAATAVRLILPWMAGRLREPVVIAAAMLGAAILFVLYPFAHAAWTMLLLSLLLGFFLGSIQPMAMSALHQVTPAHRHGEALGLRAMAINGSGVVMPLLFGTVGALVGSSSVFWIVGAGVGVFSRSAWRLPMPAQEPERLRDGPP